MSSGVFLCWNCQFSLGVVPSSDVTWLTGVSPSKALSSAGFGSFGGWKTACNVGSSVIRGASRGELLSTWVGLIRNPVVYSSVSGADCIGFLIQFALVPF